MAIPKDTRIRENKNMTEPTPTPKLPIVDVFEADLRQDNNPKTYNMQFLLQIEKITDLCHKEFLTGKKDDGVIVLPNGVTITRPIDDNREIFCNAVRFLYDFCFCKLIKYKEDKKVYGDYARAVFETAKRMPDKKAYLDTNSDYEKYKNDLVDYYRELFRAIMVFALQFNFFSDKMTFSMADVQP